jgi:hypothetical protein
VLTVVDPGTAVRVRITIAKTITQAAEPAPACNGPGRDVRLNGRAAGIERTSPVAPRKLGHVVLGSTDHESGHRFFTEGLGFKVSDVIPGIAAFLRCTTDHHNALVQAAPVPYLHHTSWQVEDVDEVGRGAFRMLDGHPERHVWGLGRHHIGSNFFWYLKARRATSPSTTATWTALSTTRSGSQKTSPTCTPSTTGARRSRPQPVTLTSVPRPCASAPCGWAYR